MLSTGRSPRADLGCSPRMSCRIRRRVRRPGGRSGDQHELLGAGGAGCTRGSLSGVQPARQPIEDLDEESAAWVCRLGAGGGERQAAERELYARLVRIALAEVRRRSASTPVTGPELDDVAHQAAGDAMLAILAKLGDFRGESRVITR